MNREGMPINSDETEGSERVTERTRKSLEKARAIIEQNSDHPEINKLKDLVEAANSLVAKIEGNRLDSVQSITTEFHNDGGQHDINDIMGAVEKLVEEIEQGGT